MMGKSTGSMEISELKMERPIWRASRAPGEKSGNAADQGEQQRLRKEDGRNREIARAESFHQADFDAALINGRGHGSGNGESGSQKRGERDQQHQSFNAREHRAFVLRDLADLLGVRMWNDFLQLVGNRLDVRRAVPAVVNFRSHRLGIACGERIRGLGQSADVNSAHRAGFPENLLRECEGRDDLVILGAAGGENAGDGELAAGDL